MGRILCGLLLTLCVAIPVFAQVRTAKGKPAPPPPAAPRAAYNSTAKDTTPFNCDQYRRHPHPMMMGYCNSIENMTLQNEARRAGRPAPSSSVIVLPGLGAPEAKQLGYACVGGQAFKRLSNGWEQVHAPDGGWQRCQGG
ncbi:hypothetical protein [Pseudoxanthomonas indica]|uniref:Secreted protein n=1 Tax=Pseudoxanthomonas indica TaxID=428993 RepID=A0A1T5IK32_9GAMM|nr:hypothetical protein [Pseudoxanthomonas indica]GGD52620.1 hypothetical protein GCM10007235_26030 [Pseudoxanthomonas indica]SKC39392.1 hypothetical protein SAMN06296058_0017 [Pseudoxanthomonas indica]